MTSASSPVHRISTLGLAVASLGLAAGRAEAAGLDQSFAPAGITRIVVELPFADRLTLEHSTGDVHVSLTGDDAPECKATLVRDGDTLRLEGAEHGVWHHHGGHHGDGDCDLVVHVAVPSSAAVEVDLGAGTVKLVGLASKLELSVGAGDIDGSLAAEAVVKTGAGRIRLRELAGPVEVKTGVGEIDLTFATAPAGKVRAVTGMGTIELGFPAGTAVDANLESGFGSVSNALPQRDGAPTRVRASTGMGTIALNAR